MLNAEKCSRALTSESQKGSALRRAHVMNQQRQPVWILFVVMTAVGAGNGVIFPLIKNLQVTYHISDGGIGLMSGSTFVTGLVAQLALSKYADRGHARLLLVTGVLCTIVGLTLLATGSDAVQFVAARAVEGLGYGMIGPAARCVIVAARPEERGRYLGLLSSSDLGGFVMAPFVGTVLAEHVNLRAPFIALAVMVTAALMVLLVQGLPVTPTFADPPPPWSLLRMRPIVGMLLLGFALALPIGLYDPLWSIIFQDRGASTNFVAITITGFGLPFLVLAGPAGRWAEERGALKTVLQCQFLIVPCLALYGLFTLPLAMAAVAIVEGIVQAAAIPAAFSAMVAISPLDRVGAAQGLYGAAGLLSSGGVAFVAPTLYHSWGAPMLFTSAALLVAVLVLCSFRITRLPGTR